MKFRILVRKNRNMVTFAVHSNKNTISFYSKGGDVNIGCIEKHLWNFKELFVRSIIIETFRD